MTTAPNPTPTTDEPAHILVVDDDRRLRELLRKYLVESGFLVTAAVDAADARQKLAAITFDLIVLDVMMPGESGLQLTADLRQKLSTPILLLTAMSEAEDRIAGLESGADDYLPKPFEPRELVLRINSILRRLAPPPSRAAGTIRLGSFTFDIERSELTQEGERVRLTTGEENLLRILAQHAGETVSRETLTDSGMIDGGVRAVDVQVTRLRRKIEPDPRLPRYLHTVRGEGYVLRPDG
jgi:two-component system, OmpR family, phosphate regulon response regulator OmpR